MKKLLSFFLPTFLLILATAVPGRTDAGLGSYEERFKSSVNAMVQKVEVTADPSQKREIIGQFLLRMDRSVAMVETFKSLSREEESGIASLRDKIRSQYDELNGLKGHAKVADADLNSYAAYLRQDMEQADAYWTGGGIYIGVGTLILILIILLILR